MTTETISDQSDLKDWIKTVMDPEIHVSIVELGLVYKAELKEGNRARVEMTLTSPACPLGDELIQSVKDRLAEHPEVKESEVQLVWEPKWDPATMASEECKELLGIW